VGAVVGALNFALADGGLPERFLAVFVFVQSVLL
jgi:hypothetical protein